MQEYDDIEQFSGGGRISPQESATIYPEGSLRSGNNGNLWINQKDINGRLSWKATPITKQKYPLIRYSEINDQINIWLSDNLKIFYYYFDTPTLFFTYPDGKVLKIKDRLNNLSSEFKKQFDLIRYVEEKNENDLSSDQIMQLVDDLTYDLISLQLYKKLRKPSDIPETPPKPETKNFTSEQLEMFKDWIYPAKFIFLNIDTNDYYFVDDFDEKHQLLIVKGFVDPITYTFSAEEYNSEFFLKFRKLDYNPNASKKLKMITVLWSDNADLDTSVYFTWSAFQDKLKTLKLNADLSAYDKTKVFILWENNKAILDRIDIGKGGGNFNPITKFIGDFLFYEQTAMYWSNFINRRLEAFWNDIQLPETPSKPEKIFKVGDIVKLPTTKLSKKLKINMSFAWDRANQKRQDYLFVNEVIGKKIVLNDYLDADGDGDYFNITLDKIELYEDPLEETEVKTDDTKITSKRTKEFYENNKSKLDKIDSKISNKFIEALAFLSQYEESGEVVYTNQNKSTANDLISRIQNLKKTN